MKTLLIALIISSSAFAGDVDLTPLSNLAHDWAQQDHNRRQGGIAPEGAPILYPNGYPSGGGFGGQCHFQMVYDPQLGTYIQVSVCN